MTFGNHSICFIHFGNNRSSLEESYNEASGLTRCQSTDITVEQEHDLLLSSAVSCFYNCHESSRDIPVDVSFPLESLNNNNQNYLFSVIYPQLFKNNNHSRFKIKATDYDLNTSYRFNTSYKYTNKSLTKPATQIK